MVFQYGNSNDVPPIEIKPDPDYIISPGPNQPVINESEEDCGCGCNGKCGKKKRWIITIALVLIGTGVAIYFTFKKK